MNRCILCTHCVNEFDEENESGTFFVCQEKDLEDDKRFPYNQTTCSLYQNDTSIEQLIQKHIYNPVAAGITWELKVNSVKD